MSRRRRSRLVAALLRPAPALAAAIGLASGLLWPAGTPARAAWELGVNVHALWDYGDIVEDPALLDASLGRLRAAGASWVRFDVGWASIERSGPGDREGWYLERLETALRLAHGHGLKVLATVWRTPWWAADPPIAPEWWAADPTYWDDTAAVRRPAGPGHFHRFVRWMAERYAEPADPGLRVDAWELWNEPNIPAFWDPPGDREEDVRDYVDRVLAPGYRGVKEASPEATVLVGGPASTAARMDGDVPSSDDRYWLNALYRHGGGAYFDVMAIHPYVVSAHPGRLGPEHPGDPGHEEMTILNVEHVRALMEHHGDAGKPIWFTEFGWSTHDNDCIDGACPTGWQLGVDQATQADYLVRTLELLRSQPRWGVEVVMWYVDRDHDVAEEDAVFKRHLDGFGLLTRDLAPKPAYRALARLASG